MKPETAQTPIRKPAKQNAKIDPIKAIQMRFKGNSYSDIARVFGCTKGAVFQRIEQWKDLVNNDDELKVYNSNETEFLQTAKNRFLLAALDPAKIKAASSLQLASCYGIVYDKYRINQGLSTQNISLHSSVQVASKGIEEAQERLKQLTESLHVVDATPSDK